MRKVKLNKEDDDILVNLLHNAIHEIGDEGPNGWEGKRYLRAQKAFDHYLGKA